jgi:hypothetical protein
MIWLLIAALFHLGWMIFWNKALKWFMATPNGARRAKENPKTLRLFWFTYMTPVVGQAFFLISLIELLIVSLVIAFVKVLAALCK